jgi:spore photoproduct lyase
LESRIKAAKAALDKGWRVRICFDPILPFEAWEEAAEQMLDLVQESIDLKAIEISIGGFRMSVPHFKSLKRMHPAISYPFLINDGSIVKCKEEEIEKMRIMVDRRLV